MNFGKAEQPLAQAPPSASSPPVREPGKLQFASTRLRRELNELAKETVEGIRVVKHDHVIRLPGGEQQIEWQIEISGAAGTPYEGETYTLRLRFSENYPLESPEVVFVGGSPEHCHVYSNGHICLSILYDAWSPALTVSAICLSLISMLSSAKTKERPPDDAAYSRGCGSQVSPKQMRW